MTSLRNLFIYPLRSLNIFVVDPVLCLCYFAFSGAPVRELLVFGGGIFSSLFTCVFVLESRCLELRCLR